MLLLAARKMNASGWLGLATNVKLKSCTHEILFAFNEFHRDKERRRHVADMETASLMAGVGKPEVLAQWREAAREAERLAALSRIRGKGNSG